MMMESRTSPTLVQIIQLVCCLLLVSSVGVSSSLARQEAQKVGDRDRVQIIDEPVPVVSYDYDEDDGEYYFDLENQLSSSSIITRPSRNGNAGASSSRVRRTRSPNPYSYERRVLYRAEEGPPKVQATVPNVQAVVGSNATLECFIESYPKSVNYWIINSERLKVDTDKYKISDERTNARNFEYSNRLRLHIINVDGSDYSSVFRCFATNDYGTNYKAIRIEGHAPIIETEEKLTIVEASLGAGFVLECIISAVPDGINYWTKKRSSRSTKDVPVNSTSRISITQHPYNDNLYKSVSRLRVINVELEDFSTYKCKSKNRNGEAERKFQVIKSSYTQPKRNDKLTSSAAAAAAESLPITRINLKYIFIISTSLFIASLR